MKGFLIVLYFAMSTPLFAQLPYEQIVKAERNFEKDCRTLGIKQGFLTNLDSASAVSFTQEGIESAYKYWSSLPDVPGIYSWAPSFVEVSKGGDWGYSTGAVEYRDTSINDQPSSYTQYTTVWQKNKKGEWKYIVDIGNTHDEVKIDSIAKEIKVEKVPVKTLSKQTILDLENKYSTLMNTVGENVLKTYAGKSYILNMNGYSAIASRDSALKVYKLHSAFIQYFPFDVKTSSRGDMAVVYGKMKYKGVSKYYIRIWRRETTGWKVALEVAKI
jgi:ketosteroid isomerase-like protein